jgi:hypothetical protein
MQNPWISIFDLIGLSGVEKKALQWQEAHEYSTFITNSEEKPLFSGNLIFENCKLICECESYYFHLHRNYLVFSLVTLILLLWRIFTK